MEECYLVVSDIHGNDDGLSLIKDAVSKYNPKAIISCGDQCPDLFEPLYSELISVRGNCDTYYSYGNIPFPPLYRQMELFGRKTIITHGDRYYYNDFDLEQGSIFLSGHTHVPVIEERDGIYLFNPGSPSRPRSSSGPSAGLIFPFGLRLVSLRDFKILSAMDFS